jgi:hypothetical protein
MKKVFLFLIAFLWVSISLYAQKKAPKSIYTFNSLKKDIHNTASLKANLKVYGFKFKLVNAHNTIEEQIPPLNFKQIGKEVSEYVYDSYEKYENSNLLEGFSFKNDPTRWNLSCKKNRVQPYFLKQQKLNN